MTLENALKIVFGAAEELHCGVYATTYRDSITKQKTDINIRFEMNEWVAHEIQECKEKFPSAYGGGSGKTYHKAIYEFAAKIQNDRKSK